jgi:hypothetical protein
MKTRFNLSCLALVLILAACQPAAPTDVPTPPGQEKTQAAATYFADQAATQNSLNLTASAPTATDTPLPPPTATPTPAILNIRIDATACWVDTAIPLTAGQAITINASGMANTWEGKDISNGDPDGQPANQCGAISCPLRGAQYGALIGKVGEAGETFLVGSHLEFTAAADGNLFLTINDMVCTDNSGGFDVAITMD